MPQPASVPPGLAAAFDRIQADAETATADLARMLAVDTRFPPGAGYADFAALIEEMVAPLSGPLGWTSERVTVPRALWHVADGPAEGERVNLVVGPVPSSPEPVCGLYFHVDTVPVADGWTRHPLRMTREGDNLYGLGAADMKGTIAAVLLAVRAAVACSVALVYRPMLLLCTDEEGGLYPGVRYLAEQGKLRGHILNFNGTAAPRIWAGCFGLFNLRLVLEGRAAHAGDSAAGAVNAIEGALPVLKALVALKPVIAARVSALPAPPTLGRPLSPLLTVAAAHGGTGGSQVPGRFVLTINRRYAPEEDYAAARAELETAIAMAVAQTPGLRVRCDLIGHLIPTGDPTGPHWPRWQRALSAGFGYAPEEFRAWGASTCSDFGYVQQTGMREILLTGLGRPERNVHAADEHTTLSDIVALAQSVLAYFAAAFAPDLIPENLKPGVPA